MGVSVGATALIWKSHSGRVAELPLVILDRVLHPESHRQFGLENLREVIDRYPNCFNAVLEDPLPLISCES